MNFKSLIRNYTQNNYRQLFADESGIKGTAAQFITLKYRIHGLRDNLELQDLGLRRLKIL